jgi:hypothetical protein
MKAFACLFLLSFLVSWTVSARQSAAEATPVAAIDLGAPAEVPMSVPPLQAGAYSPPAPNGCGQACTPGGNTCNIVCPGSLCTFVAANRFNCIIQ